MFRASSIMIINKIDLRPHLDFGVHKAIKNALAVNPNVTHLSSLRAIGSRTLFGSSIAADSARHQGAVRATVDPISEHRDRGFVRHLVGTRTREDQERRQGHRPQNRIDLKAMQASSGIDEPDYGYLFDMILPDGAKVKHADFCVARAYGFGKRRQCELVGLIGGQRAKHALPGAGRTSTLRGGRSCSYAL